MIPKSSTKTGVADYFAVLGIPSFLDDDDDVDASTTPRSDCGDLSSSPSGQRAAADDDNNDDDGNERKEDVMHLERFHREIVRLALLPSSMDSTESNEEWTICQSNSSTSLSADAAGASSHNNALHLYGASLNLSGVECDSVRIAYQCRGQHQRRQNTSEDNTDNAAAPTAVVDSIQTNEEYYNPAMADVSIHYVKVHPLSIPNYTYVESSTRQSHQENDCEQQHPHAQESSRSMPNTMAQATKTLSFLARRTTGLGKEIVGEGLINVVKGVRGMTAGQNDIGSAAGTAIHRDTSQKNDMRLDDNSDRDKFKERVTQNNDRSEDAHSGIKMMSRHNSDATTRQHFFPDTPGKAVTNLAEATNPNNIQSRNNNGLLHASLSEMLPLPSGCDEWIVPSFCQTVYLPTCHQLKKMRQQKLLDSSQQLSSEGHTHLLPTSIGKKGRTSPSSMGVEAMYISPLSSPTAGLQEMDAVPMSSREVRPNTTEHCVSQEIPDPTVIPSLVPWSAVPSPFNSDVTANSSGEYVYIPILAVRRQRIGEEERYHEDPALVDIQLSRLDSDGKSPPVQDDEEDDDENNSHTTPMMQHGIHPSILKKSPWTPSSLHPPPHQSRFHPIILLGRNIPNGLADVPFEARVLDRFPQKNYREMPFPEEELPMFCYARGSCLVRDKLKNLSVPKSYGFVVKNERGDSIYEPLTIQRQNELDRLSRKRQRTSLPHRIYCQRIKARPRNTIFDQVHMVGFEEIVTFESKTICLVGRYAYWTAFRHFLTHLHILSGLSSDTPIERHISHLLLAVPKPKPGGQCILVPMSTMREPMALLMPPLKDLPLLDLSYKMLFSALDVPTVVTIVLGFLCLEKKVILISTRQSLVLDCCELLKSLLFPFELCAPYVPHLTAPFAGVLEFPGAIFVGLHDDGDDDGLANIVRKCIPEDSIIVELDSGEIKSDGNRYETLKAAYQIIPSSSRSNLTKEVESLCQDAGMVPGQEPLDYSINSTIDSSVPSNLSEALGNKLNRITEPLDDRAIGDCFLRFFCSILGGYERFLVVPDADFMVSGDDWFDASKFLAANPSSRSPYLSSLVGTQLFQSFVQRRTESSDIHCVLFDECLAEYHSSKIPYGLRGNGDLLVDQCATEPDILFNEDDSFQTHNEIDEKSYSQPGSDTTTQISFGSEAQFALNGSGDIVTVPSITGLPPTSRFTYCVDGQPSFPTAFHRQHFLPKEPEHLCTDANESLATVVIRSDREREEATRLLNMTISRHGPQKQHRCLWQLPKFMGSQFLGAWLICIPTQLSQPNLSLNGKSAILLRALGALRTLRSHRRIVADEAAYRSLIVACGKCGTDRRVELMKLYGLMRMDGIFPNAVTLGQYTKSIAEGYSKRLEDTQGKVGMQISTNVPSTSAPFNLDILDNNLQILEESGKKWRSQGNASQAQESTPAEGPTSSLADDRRGKPVISPAKTFDTNTTAQRQSKHKRAWIPITCSSSFRPTSQDSSDENNQIGLVALWTRIVSCNSCNYVPLDEEIQCGWDVIHSAQERSPSITCSRCGAFIVPLLGFKHLELSQALKLTGLDSPALDDDLNSSRVSNGSEHLPPQLDGSVRDCQPTTTSSINHQSHEGYVTYLSPYKLRRMLEQLVHEYGEQVLRRDRLLETDPQIFYNLWWYCARFSLPLPLAIELPETESNNQSIIATTDDICAFASWDKSVAIYGCQSAAQAISAAQSLRHSPDRVLREKLFDNPSTDNPIFSFFNFQNYAQSDWDHPDLSEVLVALVKACETRDLLPVVECIFERNLIRNQEARGNDNTMSSFLNSSIESAGSVPLSMGGSSDIMATTELDCYRTILYLARYQCMTAFHAFFPTVSKACKGYHFWCPYNPWSIFDRAFREAAQEYGTKHKLVVPIPDVSDVAIGFRCIFGHVI